MKIKVKNQGYTLFEVLAVLAIIAITFSIVTLKVQKSINEVEKKAIYNKMILITQAEQIFYATKGKNSIDFLNKSILTGSSQLVREGLIDWDSDFSYQLVWEQSDDGKYFLNCLSKNFILEQELNSYYQNALFVEFPDDGITEGGTGDPVSDMPTQGDDNLIGTDNNDFIDALSGNDIVKGKDGHDIINGGNGDDIIYGNAGEDTLSGGNNNDTIYGGEHNDYVSGGNGNDTIYGESGNDTLDGNNNDDTIFGGLGEDIIYGFNGKDKLYGNEDNDLIYGENGNDILNGGSGDDYLYGGSGTDTAEYLGNIEEYIITKISKTHYTVSHTEEGLDHLHNIEKIKFANWHDKLKKLS